KCRAEAQPVEIERKCVRHPPVASTTSSTPKTGVIKMRFASSALRGSVERERCSVQLFGPLDLDQDRMSLLLRTAVLFGLDEPPPHLFVNGPRPVDLRPAVEAGNPALRQQDRKSTRLNSSHQI